MRMAYYCVGGPLDGTHATNLDFAAESRKWVLTGLNPNGTNKYDQVGDLIHGEGLYYGLRDEYVLFNRGARGTKRAKAVWLHKSHDIPEIPAKSR